MEDLWDETIFEEPIKFKNPNVLNIPAIMDNFENAKAAKKAMRKARKEAKKFVKSSKHKHKRKKHKKERNYSGEDEKHTIQRYFEILKILLNKIINHISNFPYTSGNGRLELFLAKTYLPVNPNWSQRISTSLKNLNLDGYEKLQTL